MKNRESAAEQLRHLTQTDLARRWRISPRTLERWRWLGTGPAYLKIGGHVVYRMEDVEAFERRGLRMIDGGVRPLPGQSGSAT